jgi:hypothetical protein
MHMLHVCFYSIFVSLQVISHGKAHGHQFATFVPYISVKILATIASVQNFAQAEVQKVTVTMWTTLISVKFYTKLYKFIFIAWFTDSY